MKTEPKLTAEQIEWMRARDKRIYNHLSCVCQNVPDFPTLPTPYAAPMQQGWIRCEERMPTREPMDHGEEVLCYSEKSGEYLIGLLYYKFPNTLCESDETILMDITHWQPLPEKPTK